MRCSNCLSHVEIKSNRGVCSSCGCVVDVKFGDGTNALGAKRGLFGKVRLLSISGFAALLVVVGSAIAVFYLMEAGKQDGPTQASVAPLEITAQKLTSSRFDDFEAGEIVAALNIRESQLVSIVGAFADQSLAVLISPSQESAQPKQLFELQRNGTLRKREMPQDVRPDAVAGMPNGDTVVAYAAGDDLIVTLVSTQGIEVWRRPIFLDGQSIEYARISATANTILIETAMQESNKTVHYLLNPDGRLASLRTFEGSGLPPAILLSDGSVVTTDLFPLSDRGAKNWSVTNTNADGRVIWKTRLPQDNSRAFAKTFVSSVGETYVLSEGARLLVKIASDGSLDWQEDVRLPIAPEAYDLFEVPNGNVIVVSLSKALDGTSVLNSIGFAPNGSSSTSQEFELNLEVSEPSFTVTAEPNIYLTGRGLLQRSARDSNVFVVALDRAVIASAEIAIAAAIIEPERIETPAPVEEAIVAPVIESAPLSTPVAEEEIASPQEEEAAALPEDEVDGFDWVTYPSAECRFICLDDNGSPLRMGRTLTITDDGTAPDIAVVHKEICQLAGAVPEAEEEPACEGISQ